MSYPFVLFLLVPVFSSTEGVSTIQVLPDTQPLIETGDLASAMVDGIDTFLTRELQNAVRQREEYWQRNSISPENRNRPDEPNRRWFLTGIGAIDPRERVEMIAVNAPTESSLDKAGASFSTSAPVGEGKGYHIFSVRWNVIAGVEGEGLLMQPDRPEAADIIALPDCDWSPELLIGLVPGVPVEAQYARRLAENGCRVLVPVLMDRRDRYSGIPGIKMTNQPHREFIYRAAYEMGRHIIGYEVQKVLAAVDWFSVQEKKTSWHRPMGVIGYGEGGLIAFYSAAADPRVDAAAVCGYFQPREQLWREPIYRNVWGLLRRFGDAEIAGLIAPRILVIEACRGPEIAGPPKSPDRQGAAPGILTSASFPEIEREYRRALARCTIDSSASISLIPDHGAPGSEEALQAFLKGLGIARPLLPPGDLPKPMGKPAEQEARFKRQFDQLLNHTQSVMRESEFQRERFWPKANATDLSAWQESFKSYRDYLWEEVIGRLPTATVPMNPHSRLIYDEPKFRGYEVRLDVYANVYAYGILLIPKDIRNGERRPVVVCQHGLEGRPQDVADPKNESPYYHRFACRLAEQGFVTFSPQNPYIGGDAFRVLQRKANPLKLSLFSFIVRQHERILEWLASLPFTDSSRMAFYGLSYGGKTAMRVPALLPNYCLSICSGDFNEWIWKNVSARHKYTYLLTGEYEMPEFNLGNTFNYFELSGLICPRPFMVERGHLDGVAPDEWVAYEYAKTRRLYDRLGIGDRTEIEFFNGPHTIHGVGTFQFLHKHLHWPETK